MGAVYEKILGLKIDVKNSEMENWCKKVELVYILMWKIIIRKWKKIWLMANGWKKLEMVKTFQVGKSVEKKLESVKRF